MDRKLLENKAFDFATLDMQNICEDKNEIMDEIRRQSDSTLIIYIAECKMDGFKHDYNHLALLRAEDIGVYAYTVSKNKLKYISYYGTEGFYNVTYDLDTGEEVRKHQKTTSKEYNYFCG